jgi:hypothetical protein
VQADDIAFAEGCDLESFVLAAGFADRVLDGNGCAGGRVFLVDVVALENLAGIIAAARATSKKRFTPTEKFAA